MPLTTRQRNFDRKILKIKLTVVFLICLILWRAQQSQTDVKKKLVASTHSVVKRWAIILLYLSYTTNDATVPPHSRQFLFHFILLLLNFVRCMTFGLYWLVLRTSSTNTHSFTHSRCHCQRQFEWWNLSIFSHISFIRFSFFFSTARLFRMANGLVCVRCALTA